MNKYLKWIVILANLGTLVTIFLMESYDGGHSVKATLPLLYSNQGYLWIIITSLVASIGGVFVSTIKPGTYREIIKILLGISVLLLFYVVLNMFTCTGFLCELDGYVYGGLPLIAIGVFFIFFAIGMMIKRWGRKFVIPIIWTEAMLIGIAVLILIFFSYFYISMDRLKNDVSVSVEAYASLCQKIPYGMRSTTLDCWRDAIEKSPGIDICTHVAEDRQSYKDCNFMMEILYRGKTNGCDGKPIVYDVEGNSKEDQAQRQCWIENAKKFPGLDICKVGSNWNTQRCYEVIQNSL